MSKPLTLDALAASAWKRFWVSSKNAPTVKGILSNLLSTFGEDQQVHRITTKMVEDGCARWLAKGLTKKTCNRRISCLSKMLKWAERSGRISKAPYLERYAEGVGRLRYASGEEEALMIKGLQDAGHGLSADFVAVLADTGMRRTELLSLRWEQVEDDSLLLEETKNGRSRKIPLTTRAQGILRELRHDPRGPFQSITRTTFAYRWNAVKRSMGLEDDKGFVPHCLRHAFACRLLQRGARIEVVSRLLGHNDIGTTINRYFHESPGDTESAVALLEPEVAL
jgi:integrase